MRSKYVTLLLLAACPLASFSQAEPPRVLETRFVYKATVPALPVGAKNLKIWLPIPSDGEQHTVSNLKVDCPDGYTVMRGQSAGSRLVMIQSDNAKAPYEVSVSFDLARKGTAKQGQQTEGPLSGLSNPRAEADGKPVETTWKLSYEILGADALQSQIDELRQMVLKQQAEIEALKAERGAPVPPPLPPGPKPDTAVQDPSVVSQSGDKVTIYGSLRGDVIYDTQKPNNAQSPMWITSGTSDEQFSLHPRLSRLGLDLAAGRQGPFDVTGKIELDFQGGGSESRNTPRARHLYVQLKQGQSAWIIGQTSDLISPLSPSPNDDTNMWNVGNTGDRRPQIRYTYTSNDGFNVGLLLGLTGAVDAKDMDVNGTRDGEESGMPGFQARVGYKKPNFSAGIWTAFAREETALPVGGETQFETSVAGIDWQAILGKIDLAGEIWFGENLSDLRGGIGQGVNTTTGSEISSKGGWVELGYKPSPTYRIAIGYTKDDPSDSDLTGSGRLENSAFYLHNKWNVGDGVEIGANYLHWLTDWAGLPRGKNHRFNFFLMRKF